MLVFGVHCMSGRCSCRARHLVCMRCTSLMYLHGASTGVEAREIRCPVCRALSDRHALCQPANVGTASPSELCRGFCALSLLTTVSHTCMPTCAIVVHACPAYPQEDDEEQCSRLDRVLLMALEIGNPIAGWMWCAVCWRGYFVDEFTPGYRCCLGCTEALS